MKIINLFLGGSKLIMMTYNYIVQGIGFLALFFGVSAFLFKDEYKLKTFMSIASLLFSIQFFLLDSLSASLLKLISFIRNYLSIKQVKNNKNTAYIFILFYIASGLFFYKAPVDIITIIGVSCSTYGIFNLKGIPMRLMFIPATISWLLTAIYYQSVGAIILESIILFVNLLTITRVYKDTKKITTC